MGRGRAKAKQTKVARNLKYNSGPDTDLAALQRELASDKPGAGSGRPSNLSEDDEQYEDDYDGQASFGR